MTEEDAEERIDRLERLVMMLIKISGVRRISITYEDDEDIRELKKWLT